ncbi:MAG: pyridoxal phosphate-dependent aminotransferase family protein [Candidatus Tritonobacter lacicola]|nr:pyridoxal phosphate-dependent aminotransferase family protein [Candidatus Tritonobacter lacicola]
MSDLERDFSHWASIVEEVKKAGVYGYSAISQKSSGTRIILDGRELLLFANNDYLGLMDHPAVIEKAIKALKDFGSSTCSSQITLSTSIHQQLESELASFVGAEDAVLYPSCYMCNIGTITSITQKGDVIISDKNDHASIIDGVRLSEARVRFFKHNDMSHLEKILGKCGGYGKRIVIVDGVYSMEGDLAPLPELCELCEKYDAILIVDDAHGAGVMGENGVGTAEWFGVNDRIDVKIGTLSKALVSIGGFTAGGKNLITCLRHSSRTCVFSTVIPPSSAAASLAALEIVRTQPERRKRLWENVVYYRTGLGRLGYNTLGSVTAIVPVLLGSRDITLRIAILLRERGIFTVPIVPPAIKDEQSRLRTNVMATHTKDEIDQALEAFAIVGRECGII